MSGADIMDEAAPGADHAAVAKILAFPGAPRIRAAGRQFRFTLRDRMTALHWAGWSRKLGYTRLVFEQADAFDDGESREYLLIYAGESAWASWGIGCSRYGMKLWHSPRGNTIDCFHSLSAALDEVARLSA